MDKKVEKQRASYRTMAESTKEDWEIIGSYATGFNADLPNRILDHLKMLRDDHGGFAVDRLEHSLQTATKAYKDNRDEEYVVCALLHDIGDILLFRYDVIHGIYKVDPEETLNYDSIRGRWTFILPYY